MVVHLENGRPEHARNVFFFDRLDFVRRAGSYSLHEIEDGATDIKLARLVRIAPVHAVEGNEIHELGHINHVDFTARGEADGKVNDERSCETFRIGEFVCPAIAWRVAAMRGDDQKVVGE